MSMKGYIIFKLGQHSRWFRVWYHKRTGYWYWGILTIDKEMPYGEGKPVE